MIPSSNTFTDISKTTFPSSNTFADNCCHQQPSGTLAGRLYVLLKISRAMTTDERKQRLYDATHQGADIIRMSHSGAAAVIGTNKKFRLRDEDDPSACVEPPRGNRTYWQVHDYGDRAFNPIDFYIHTSGLDPQRDFFEALEQLERRFNCADTLSKQDNRYEFRQYNPTEEQRRQGYGLDIMEGYSPQGFSQWGQGVTPEVLQQTGWLQLKSYWWYNDEKNLTYEITASDRFAVFVQRCPFFDKQHRYGEFFKLYQPQHYDKSRRFRYFGTVPPGYVFCLDAVKQAVEKLNENADGGEDGEDEGRQQRIKKLPRVLVVSGCSDCVNAWAMGVPAVYGMSEVGGISKEVFAELSRLAWKVVCIPDIDDTGCREAKQQALRLPDLYTAWPMPEDMGLLPDNRGNRKKDLKDYRSLHPTREDFMRLVNREMKARFYSANYNEKRQVSGYSLSNDNIGYFLWLHGYGTLRQDSAEQPAFIHIHNKMVRSLSADALRNEFMEICRREAFPKEVIDKLYNSPALPTEKKSMLRRFDGMDFSKATLNSQLFFFTNGVAEVTATGIKLRRMTELTDRYVWADSVIRHEIRILPQMFNVSKTEKGETLIEITPEGRKCKLLTLLCNVSRLYWRKADEQHLELTPAEQGEEQQCLLAHLVNLGYLFYTHKIASEAFLTLFIDHKLGSTSHEANGGTGKSAVIDFIRAFKTTKEILANNKKIFESNFFYAGVTEAHDVLAIDECIEDTPWDYFKSAVTNDLITEAKQRNPVTIPFEKSPKLLAATNFVVKDESPSIVRRLWPITFGDYYHKASRLNDYREDRKVSDTFGCELFDKDYPEEDWVLDINLTMQCVQLYLSLPKGQRKILPPMHGIEQRINQKLMGTIFEEVASRLIFPESEFVNIAISQKKVMEVFAKEGYHVEISENAFTRKLKAFCASHGYVVNPVAVTGKKCDGDPWQKKENGRLLTYYYIAVPTETVEAPDTNIYQGDDAPPF